MDVPIDRFLLPKDLQAMLEVFLNELHESRFTNLYISILLRLELKPLTTWLRPK